MPLEQHELSPLREGLVADRLERAFREQWGGALRIRGAGRTGAIWLIRGNAVHAKLIEGALVMEGIAALEAIAVWEEGTLLLESGALPPERSIRLPMGEILAALPRPGRKPGTQREPEEEMRFNRMCEVLQRRLPGLECVRVVDKPVRPSEPDREVEHPLPPQEAMLMQQRLQADRVYVQYGSHSLLVLRNGDRMAVLEAENSTAAEALLWAGDQVHRELLSPAQSEEEQR